MIVHCDGSCYNRDGRMGVGIAFFKHNESTPFATESITIKGKGTSNEAEYHAIINALQTLSNKFFEDDAVTYPLPDVIIINTDSEIVYSQITGICRCVKPKLQELLKEVLILVKRINSDILFNWIPRTDERQKIVDKLSKDGNPYFQHKKQFGY